MSKAVLLPSWPTLPARRPVGAGDWLVSRPDGAPPDAIAADKPTLATGVAVADGVADPFSGCPKK